MEAITLRGIANSKPYIAVRAVSRQVAERFIPADLLERGKIMLLVELEDSEVEGAGWFRSRGDNDGTFDAG